VVRTCCFIVVSNIQPGRIHRAGAEVIIPFTERPNICEEREPRDATFATSGSTITVSCNRRRGKLSHNRLPGRLVVRKGTISRFVIQRHQ
jgi:hypothetical protein